MLFWSESVIKSHRVYLFLNEGCAEGVLTVVGTGALRLSQIISRLLWGCVIHPRRNLGSSHVDCQHRIAMTLPVKGKLCKKKKGDKKKEIYVLGGPVSVVVDCGSQAALPCSTWHGSAWLLRHSGTDRGLCCTLQRQFASLLTEI